MTLSGRLRKLCALVFAALLALSISAPALGQPATDGYKSHMENGIKLFQDKNYAAAITEFRAAYDAHPKASPLVNIALCYKAEFKYPKAIQSLEKALKDHGDSMDANDRRAAEDAIKEMRGLLGYVTVKVAQNAGVIQVDGEDAAQVVPPKPPATVSATEIAIGPGSHKIGVRLDGFETKDVEVTVASGTHDKTVAITLIPTKAWVSIQTPGMSIAIDGKAVGSERYTGFIDPGQHVFQVYAGKFSVATNAIAIAGQPLYLKSGPRGTLLVYPAQNLQSVPPTATPPTKKPPEKPEPPPPPEPQRRGFYVLGGVNLVWPLTHAKDDNDTNDQGFDLNSGWSGGLIGGYRVNNNAGFQLLFDYQNIFSPSSDQSNAGNTTRGYTESTFHLGGGVRLMTSGRTVRLVGDLDGGLAIDKLSYSGVPSLGANSHTDSSPQAFLMADGGLEIDLNGVLLDGYGGFGVQTTRGTDASPKAFTSPLGTFSLGLRVGYAFWK